MPNNKKQPAKRGDIPKPKEDVRIEDGKPKFNAVLSAILKKPIKKEDEGTK
ncbi:hypothetical protein [Flavobacterium sp. BFFFF1]|uniref:hypothetical protein n=1 Tax=Flavobacterium sp. BFFFF1 TaxID=2015557 RepID=UPI0025C3DC28|nr:hypothetical protein [Flavobacterium sp. BFFFF1]